jgi:NAD(P)-dependent dehydrogenase (short-subunit alcohol dehydrogenase family)
MSAQKKPEIVAVTGASGGIGRAIAHSFAKRGAHVGLLARGEEGLEGARREVESFGGRALVLPTDVSSFEQVESAAQEIEAHFGEIDVWVNDAMSTVFARFLDTHPEEFRQATEVTYLGTVYGTMAALRRMAARDRGKIVQVGSALSYRAIPLQAAYCGASSAFAASPTRSAPSCCTTAAGCRSRWCSCPG